MKVKNCINIFCSSTCHCAVNPDVTVWWLEENDTLHVQIGRLRSRCDVAGPPFSLETPRSDYSAEEVCLPKHNPAKTGRGIVFHGHYPQVANGGNSPLRKTKKDDRKAERQSDGQWGKTDGHWLDGAPVLCQSLLRDWQGSSSHRDLRRFLRDEQVTDLPSY